MDKKSLSNILRKMNLLKMSFLFNLVVICLRIVLLLLPPCESCRTRYLNFELFNLIVFLTSYSKVSDTIN